MSCKWSFLRTLPNCKGYDPWHHARTEFIWKYNSTDDHRWALNRQPPRKLCLQESLDQKTQCSFSILCVSHQSMMRFYQFLCTDADFSKKVKSPRLNPHVLSQRLVDFFISLKINLFCRVLHKIPLFAWETITSHLYCFSFSEITEPGFQLPMVWMIIFSLEFPLKHFLTLLYLPI